METLFVNSVNPVQVELTDFVGNPEAARGNINAWVEKLTKGHIKDLGMERVGPLCTFIFASVGFSS
jgi:serine protease inhibitor